MLNHFFNMAAFNPRGREGPQACAAARRASCSGSPGSRHQSANLFSTADAHGPFRPSLVAGSCQTLRSLADDDQPEMEFLMNLTPLLTNPALCGE